MGSLFLYNICILFSLILKSGANETECEGNGMNNKKSVGDEITYILNNMQRNYDKRVRPNYGAEAVAVGISMYILNVYSVSEVEMDFTIDFYFRQIWKDPRLGFDGGERIKYIVADSDFAKGIWKPDTVFTNEKRSYFHEATSQNEYFRISPEGNVLRSTRLTVTASCPMDLSYFPMDSQLCSLDLESYGTVVSDLHYYWSFGHESILISSDVTLPQFKIVGYKQQARNVKMTTGNYSHLLCTIKFSRPVGYYLIQIYIPAGLIVIISWVSFWLNSTSARVAHGLTTVLTMATLMSSTNATLPKVSYIKAMDLYLATCFFMVFASLLENATVGFLSEKIQCRKNQQHSKTKEFVGNIVRVENEEPRLNKIISNDNDPSNAKGTNPGKIYDTFWAVTPVHMDKYSRLLFPVLFILFNVLYWIIYLNISNVVENDLILLEDKEF